METVFLSWNITSKLHGQPEKLTKTQNFMCQMTWYGIQKQLVSSETIHLCVFSFFLFVSQIFISSKNHPRIICSNFSFACLWLTSRHFVAVICQCLLFFAEGKLLQSSSMHRVWHCTRKQTDSLSCFWSHLSETVPKHMDWRGNQPWQGGIWLSSLCYFINNKFKHRQPTLNHINELVMNYNHTHIAHSHTLSLTYFQIFFEVFEWDHPSCTTWRMTLLLLKIWLA